MTQLFENLSDSDTVLSVDSGSEQSNGFKFRIDDEILTFLGYDRDSTYDIVNYLAGDRTRWRVARAQDGTEAASHTAGTDLLAVAAAFATGTDLVPPDPFAEVVSVTPTLAAVLAEGNDPDGAIIEGATNTGGTGATAWIKGAVEGNNGGGLELGGGYGATGKAGGDANLAAGWGDDGNSDGAAVSARAGLGDGTKGKVEIYTDGTNGAAGAVLTSEGQGAIWVDPATGAAEIVITEDASGAAGTYTGSVTVPGGATITGIYYTSIVAFQHDNGGGRIDFGDAGDPDGYIAASNGWDPTGDLGQTVDVFQNATYSGAYITPNLVNHAYSDTDHELTATVVVTADDIVDAPPLTGEVHVLVTWAKATPVAATFEAAP